MNDLASQLVTEEEGRVPHAYQDHLGFWTIGVGHLIDVKKGGRLPDFIIDRLLDHDMAVARAVAAAIPGYKVLNDVQRAVLESMVFQLGPEPFDGDGVKDFVHMLAALAMGDAKQAARDGRDSKWWREDTPQRAERQMKMLESGLWVPKET